MGGHCCCQRTIGSDVGCPKTPYELYFLILYFDHGLLSILFYHEGHEGHEEDIPEK